MVPSMSEIALFKNSFVFYRIVCKKIWKKAAQKYIYERKIYAIL